MTQAPESPWHADVDEPPIKPQLREELAELERQATAAREGVKAKLAVVQTRENEWRGILAAGMAAWVRLKNIREQLDILRHRHALAAAEFDKLVGSELYTREWHVVCSASPHLDGWVYGTPTKEENPFVFHARTIAALDLGIARVEKRLPEFERAEADARQAAQDYAKDNDLEHAFTAEPQPVASAPDDTDPASALADEPPERFVGKRKSTR